jgi:LPPG:FO 2-phospho-L-lactate transferase
VTSSPVPSRVVALAGGVGGARLSAGLATILGDRLTVVVNTGDDLELDGLAIWPDVDTVLYTLAGLEDRERGWGLRDETWRTMEALEALGGETWFRLGDRDLATHLFRTDRLAHGDRPTDVARTLARRLGIAADVLPMSDEPVRTQVRTVDGWLDFQDYFVRLRQAPDVLEVRLVGIDDASATPEVLDAIASADAVVICPSNPFVSVAPVLAVPGVRAAVDARRRSGVRVVAVSPIVGGRAIKGPADRMLASLGHEATALGVARVYAGLADALVIDRVDAALAAAISAVAVEPIVTDTVMTDDHARTALARTVLDVATASPADVVTAARATA